MLHLSPFFLAEAEGKIDCSGMILQQNSSLSTYFPLDIFTVNYVKLAK